MGREKKRFVRGGRSGKSEWVKVRGGVFGVLWRFGLFYFLHEVDRLTLPFLNLLNHVFPPTLLFIEAFLLSLAYFLPNFTHVDGSLPILTPHFTHLTSH